MKKEQKWLTGLIVGGLIQTGCMDRSRPAVSPLTSPLLPEQNDSQMYENTDVLTLRLPLIVKQQEQVAAGNFESVSPLPTPEVTLTDTPAVTQMYDPEQNMSWQEYVAWARERLINFWGLTAPQRRLLRESVGVLINQCQDIKDRTIGYRIVDSFDNGAEVDMLAWALQADTCEEKGRRWDVAESTVQAFRRCPEALTPIRTEIKSLEQQGISAEERDGLVQRINSVTQEQGCEIK